MTSRFLSAAMAAAFALMACNDPSTDHVPGLSGSDRDAHNCIASAGYEWSELSGACIRVWERGIALVNVQDPESSSGAYLVIEESGEKLELYFGGGAPVQLSRRDDNQWRDAAGTFTVILGGHYSVTDADGVILYAQETGDAVIDDDLLTDVGILSAVEDGAYPFYAVNIEFPNRETVIAFTLNIEDVQISHAELMTLKGQYVSIDYTSELEKMIVDMELESGFLMGAENREQLRDHKFERGIMGGAEITTGDLPGSFYLEDAEGGRTVFEEYITEDMMAGLGRDVIVYYQTRGRHTIKNITKTGE